MPAKLPEDERESRRKARIRTRNANRKANALPKFEVRPMPGRPRMYEPAYCPRAYKLALLGLTDAEVAQQFGISEVILNEWKFAYPDFAKSLNDGKTPFDAEVAVSMGQRARGYERPAVKIFMPQGSIDEDGNPKPVYAPYMEHYPADVNAGFRWLFNRQPDKWRDRRNVDHTGSVDVRLMNMTPDERAADAVALVQRIRARLAQIEITDSVTDAEEADDDAVDA